MQRQSAPLGCPLPHFLMFVGTVVIDNHMELPVWEFPVKVLEKTKKLLMRMTLDAPSFNSALMDQKGRHQASCPMSGVRVGEPFGLGGPQRQHGLSSVKGLNLGFFVNAYDKSVFRGTEVKAQDIRLFLLKLGVRALSAPVFHLNVASEKPRRVSFAPWISKFRTHQPTFLYSNGYSRRQDQCKQAP